MTDADLIREAWELARQWPRPRDIITRLIDALEQRGAELERANEERDSFQRVGCAAEAEVQRLRDALFLLKTHCYSMDPSTMETLIRAALRPSSEEPIDLMMDP